MTAVLEDVQEIVVDKWGTLNTATSPAKLPDGHSPDNNNIWTDERPGSIITANGYRRLGALPSNLPPTFMIDFFKTSDGSSALIISDGQNVYKTTDYSTFTTVTTGLSQFFQLRGKVIRDKLWLTNGSDSVMTYDGTTLTALDGTGGTPDVPAGKYIDYHDERVWIYGINGEPSSLRFTALTDSSGNEIAPDDALAWPTDNEIQVSEGDADVGTALFLYRGYLYASKQFSIWRIVGDDEYTYTRVKTRASSGTRFSESLQILDNVVRYIGVDGLYVFDGEESKRISDILDPASSDPGIFAFRNLQQPLLNNQFWNITNTSDFDTGTVPANIDTDNDELALIPADDSQADFAAGTHDDTTDSDNPGYLQLSRVTSGGASTNLSAGQSATLNDGNGVARIGSASQLTDGTVTGQKIGFLNSTDNNSMDWRVDLGANYAVGRVVIKAFYFDRNDSGLAASSAKIQYSSDNSSWSDAGNVTLPSSAFNSSRNTVYNPSITGGWFVDETDISTDISTVVGRYWRILIVGNKGAWAMAEFQVFQAGYEADGKFVSRTLDYGVAPHSFGSLAASITTNGESYQFFTQSSADGSTWDAEANCPNNDTIVSTVRRYLRWGVYLYSSTGISTPVIDKVYVGGTYISEIHNTGGNINQWGAFQLGSPSFGGGSIQAFYRGASTQGGVSAASWVQIVPGAVPALAVTDVYVQARIFFATLDAANAPSIGAFTFNWIVGTGIGVNTLQNVASYVWLNRYWLSAATLGATENDIVLIQGKSTFGSPWHKKDFKILSFCRFQNAFIAGSSENGTIYRLEYGFSKDGTDMDSYFITRDFDKTGFTIQILESSISLDRSGPYSLSLGISKDGGLNWTEKTIDLTRATGQKLGFTKKNNWNIKCTSFRARLRINGTDQPFAVDDLRFYYRVLPTRGDA